MPIGELAGHTHTRGTMEITGALTERPSASVEIIREEDSIMPNAFTSKLPDNIRQWGVTVQTSGSSTRKNNTIYFNASNSWTGETSKVGSSLGHNNLMPYQAIYLYQRLS